MISVDSSQKRMRDSFLNSDFFSLSFSVLQRYAGHKPAQK